MNVARRHPGRQVYGDDERSDRDVDRCEHGDRSPDDRSVAHAAKRRRREHEGEEDRCDPRAPERCQPFGERRDPRWWAPRRREWRLPVDGFPSLRALRARVEARLRRDGEGNLRPSRGACGSRCSRSELGRRSCVCRTRLRSERDGAQAARSSSRDRPRRPRRGPWRLTQSLRALRPSPRAEVGAVGAAPARPRRLSP